MTPTCRHGACPNPAGDYVLVSQRTGRRVRLCAECAESLRALGAWIVPTRPVPRGALDSPLELPAGGRTVPAAGHPSG